jgi:hypothetical protein
MRRGLRHYGDQKIGHEHILGRKSEGRVWKWSRVLLPKSGLDFQVLSKIIPVMLVGKLLHHKSIMMMMMMTMMVMMMMMLL